MKKVFSLIAVLLIAISWISWNHKMSIREKISKEDVIECYNMETLNAYQQEASQSAFASLHIKPKQASTAEQLGKMISFSVSDNKEANAYFIPSKKKSNKWLIVIQEWWGLNDNIKNEADKYYKDLGNMNVLAVDMYDGKVAATPDSAMKLMRGADMTRMVAIIKGAIEYTGKDANIYSVGWCFGGMWSLQTAILAESKAKGSVMFYGRPESNLDKLKTLQCDVIGFFGNKDQSPSPAVVNEFEKNMQSAGKKLETHRYEAGHGFANPSNPSFNAEASADAYQKAIAFLKAHG
ncbi:MAG: dienelactone hydrolase family protein [Chitinophagia bacterium]|nr:dienelactone hydrolase family protein [Chitinophagia bacterium]